MALQERRSVPRQTVRIPLRFRSIETATPGTLAAETVNLSQSGVYFTTAHPVKVGAPLELFLSMPREITGHNPAQVRCKARVVRVEPNAAASGKTGVGAHIEWYEPTAA